MKEVTRTRWWDRRRDSALRALTSALVAAAHRDLPDVLSSPSEVRPEFGALVALTQQRIVNLQTDAIQLTSNDVEFVVVNARLVMCEDFHTVTGGPMAGRHGRQGRAHARRMQLVEEVWQAEQRVVTATSLHRAEVEAQIKYGHDAIAAMDAALRTHHRMGEWLTYAAPTQIEIPEGAFEIGLDRVRSALTNNPLEDTQEGIA